MHALFLFLQYIFFYSTHAKVIVYYNEIMSGKMKTYFLSSSVSLSSDDDVDPGRCKRDLTVASTLNKPET